ncbi:MAG: tetratricopeptide repeat protein [Verrucomicrobiota bacterium]
MKLRWIILWGLLPVTLVAETGADLLRAGWEQFRQAEFNLAVKTFERGVAQTATNPTWQAQELYGLATTWALRRPGEDPVKAVELYRRAIAVAPESDAAAWSLLAIARLQHTYQAVIDKFPAHPAGTEAFLFQQAAILAAPQPATAKTATAALVDFLKTHPQSPYRYAAWKLLAHGYQILGEHEQRLAALLETLRAVETDASAPIDQAGDYWSIATLAEFDCGNFAVAREYYRKLIAEYPTDQRRFLANRELQHMDEVEARLRQ